MTLRASTDLGDGAVAGLVSEGASRAYGARRSERLALALPCVPFVLGAVLLGDWIVDDAGISFAYARNVAHLDGFVSQPGRVPVEGYSNFTWVMLLVPTFWVHLFHPVLVPKLLGALEVFASFYLLQRTLAQRTSALWPGIVVTSLLAISPPIVIWTSSGLENGTLLLLLALLFTTLLERPGRWQPKAGVLAALLAMTRPDGIVFFGAAGLVVLSEEWRGPRVLRSRTLAWSTARYAGAFAAVFLPFFTFRLAMFHLPWPHTYYAKRVYMTAGDRLHALLEPGALSAKLSDFAHGLAGPLGVPLVLATIVILIVLASRDQLRRDVAIAALFDAIAIFAFVWLDEDWMGEYRFGTAAILTSFLTAVLASHALFRARTAIGGWALVAAIAIVGFGPRLVAFATNPTTPYSDIARHARRFNRYAEVLGIAKGSMLTPDLGAELLESDLTIYDAAGLCEPAVVHFLKMDSPVWAFEHPRFYDWVFETIKPTFVSTNGFFTFVTTLEYDPRFSRDYVAINRYPDAYVEAVYHRRVHSGDFVRRDALGDPANVARLQSVPPQPKTAPWIVSWREALGVAETTPSADAATLLAAGRAARAQRDSSRAVTLFERAVDKSIDRRDALHSLGEALDHVARPDEARPVWTELLRVALRADDFDRAARATLRLDPPTPSEDQAAMTEGLRALYEQNDTAAAIAVFGELARRAPTHLGASYQLAAALDRAGRREDARPVWNRVVLLATGFGDEKTAEDARSHLR